jgi:hypothetical protein
VKNYWKVFLLLICGSAIWAEFFSVLYSLSAGNSLFSMLAVVAVLPISNIVIAPSLWFCLKCDRRYNKTRPHYSSGLCTACAKTAKYLYSCGAIVRNPLYRVRKRGEK